MAIITFIVYLTLFCAIFTSFKLHKGSGLSAQTMLVLFALKVLAGCINQYIHEHEYITNDAKSYFDQSLRELNVLSQQPSLFFREWFLNWGSIKGHYNIFNPANITFWSDLGFLVHTKYMTLASIFSLGHMYTNVIFYNVYYFVGMFMLYKVFYKMQPEKKYLFVFSIFLVPSVLFWCSGVHKDGWILATLGFLLYYTTQFIQSKNVLHFAGILVFLFLLFILRYYVFMCFLLPFLLWFMLRKVSGQKQIVYPVLFFTCILLGLAVAHFIYPTIFKLMIAKQQNFFLIRGYSDMKTPLLEPNANSYIKNLPTACNHIFLRPYLKFSDPWKYIFSSLDSLLVLCLLLVLSFKAKKERAKELFYWMLICFSLTMFLFIGYVVPNCGALLRYKSAFTPLLLASLFAMSEWTFIKRLYTIKDRGNIGQP